MHETPEPTGTAESTEPTATTAGSPPEGAEAVSPELVSPELVSPELVKLALRRVKDPELHLNVIDLGLVYDVRVEGSAVTVDMSLTSPGCPSGPEIMGDVEQQVKTVEGVEAVTVNLVWSPMWSPERIEPRVRAYLGF